MSLTKCLDCRRLNFVAATSCQGCGRAFGSGELSAQAAAEEKTFQRRSGAVFLTVLLALVAALFYAGLRGI
jgi:dsRNA-specific ribonuclease